MQGKMKTAVMTGIGQMEFTERNIPQIKPNEVLVKIAYVGICGSDLHYFESGRIGDFIVKPPFVLGHEASGTVVEVGSGVTHLKPGDRVALEPGRTCGRCEYCKTGNYNLCPDVEFFATPPYDGVFCEYAAHDANLCFKLPDNVSMISGALIEPLAVGFHAATQGGARVGQTAVITGAGCIGLMSLLALKAMGVTEIYMIDVMQNRLDMALKTGATAVINSNSRNAAEAVMEFTDGKGCDLAIETSGMEIAAGELIRIARKGGTIVFVGYSKSGKQSLPMNMALDKELTFKTIFRYRHIYPTAIKAVAGGIINPESIVTNYFEFDDIQKAMELSINNKADIVKAVIRIGG